MTEFRGTTIVAVARGGKVAVAGDGQVTMGNVVLKRTAKKIRRLHDGNVIAGFAGSTADAFTLFEKFEAKLSEFRGNLRRAAVELAKDWRTDRVLRRLEALMVVTDGKDLMLLSGTGDVIEPDDGVQGGVHGVDPAEEGAGDLFGRDRARPDGLAQRADG